jgi:predicted nucleic-acid-binding protein
MHAVDTNILVRLIARDDSRQLSAAERFVAEGAWVSLLALAEAVRVLKKAYRLQTPELAAAIEMLLDHEHLVLQSREAVTAALALFREKPALGFSDCLMLQLARQVGHLPLGTFDKDLAKLEGTRRLSA